MAPIKPGSTKIELLNVKPNEAFPHQLIYVAGQITSYDTTRDTNFVHVAVNNRDETSWQVVDGRFKCFLLLSPGHNSVQFRGDHEQEINKEITCHFRPRQTSNTVKFIYIKCKDSTGEFQALNDKGNSLDRGLKLLNFNSLLCQLFFAECFVAAGFLRRTFSLAPLEVFESELTEPESLTDEFLERNNTIFGYFYRELERRGVMEEGVKVMGVLGCTR